MEEIVCLLIRLNLTKDLKEEEHPQTSEHEVLPTTTSQFYLVASYGRVIMIRFGS